MALVRHSSRIPSRFTMEPMDMVVDVCVLDAVRGRMLASKPPVSVSTKGGDAGQRLPDRELVHFTRSLVGEHRLEVVRVSEHRVLQRDAGPAEDRPAGAGDLEGLPNVVQLTQADLLG